MAAVFGIFFEWTPLSEILLDLTTPPPPRGKHHEQVQKVHQTSKQEATEGRQQLREVASQSSA